MVKVCLISPTFYPATFYGGPIYSSYFLAREIAGKGTHIEVLTTNANGKVNLDSTSVAQEILPNLFVNYYQETRKDKLSLQLLKSLPAKIKSCDLVFLQYVFSYTTPFTLFWAKVFHKPVILSPRGSLAGWALAQGSRFKKLWLRWFVRPYLKNIVFHVTSPEEKQETLASFPSAQVAVIPNGIDVESLAHPTALSKEAFASRFFHKKLKPSHIIVSLSRLHVKKGFDILIDAFKKVLETYPEAILLVAGQDFGIKQQLEDQIKRLHLQGSVCLVGELKGQDKVDFLANADLFALPSHNENFGLVYGEALAAGTPIVASLNTPWTEAEQLGFGLRVDNTPDATAAAILQIIGSDPQKMGEVGKAYISAHFSWKSVGEKFMHLLTTLVQQQESGIVKN